MPDELLEFVPQVAAVYIHTETAAVNKGFIIVSSRTERIEPLVRVCTIPYYVEDELFGSSMTSVECILSRYLSLASRQNFWISAMY